MDTIIAAGIGAFSLLLGWFLRRLVGQNDAAIAELRTNQAAIRDRLEILRGDLKSHEAAHMLIGDRLDRPHRRDINGDPGSFQ